MKVAEPDSKLLHSDHWKKKKKPLESVTLDFDSAESCVDLASALTSSPTMFLPLTAFFRVSVA